MTVPAEELAFPRLSKWSDRGGCHEKIMGDPVVASGRSQIAIIHLSWLFIFP